MHMTKDKSLKSKAVDIKGKKYVLVSDRINFFNSEYTNGSITTELVSSPESEKIIIKATVRPDISSERLFTGYAQEIIGDGYINKTSALENAETSAVGRALAMMGIGVMDSVASVDEINKAKQIEKKMDVLEASVKAIELESNPEKLRGMLEKANKSTKLTQSQKAVLVKAVSNKVEKLTGEPF